MPEHAPRALRVERSVTLRQLAAGPHMSVAFLAAPEHGRSGAPSPGLLHRANELFRLIRDDAGELARPARLSRT